MNKNSSNITNWDLISDILTESASEKQKADFEHWLKSDNQNSVIYNEIKKVWEQSGNISHLYSESTNQAWDDVKSLTIQKKKPVTRRLLAPLAVAASLLLFVLFGKNIFIPKQFSINSNNEIIADYKLPDKSTIDLNSHSQLQYNSRFGKRKRDVWLNGEAFFDVKKDIDNPFLIHTNGGVFKVLGTSFNISAKENAEIVCLSVKTGIVEFFPEGIKGSVKAGKGFEIKYNTRSHKVTRVELNQENYMAWKTKNLEFNKTPLTEVAEILENTYNIKIEFKDFDFNELTFTAKFKEKPIDKIIHIIALSLNLEVEKRDETFIFTKTET